jgi:hypothetical protein
LKYDTLKKAKKTGRIVLPLTTQNHSTAITTKSQRNHTDDNQAIGKACSNLNQRVLSAVSGVKCPIQFNNQIDLQHAGVLIAIPALLSQGLLRYEQDFELDSIYYPTSSIFLALAILTLFRVKTLSGVNSLPSGEIGRTISETITDLGFNPIQNLSGHGVSHFNIHDSPSIPNFDNGDDTTLEKGDTIAIEPFATTGNE